MSQGFWKQLGATIGQQSRATEKRVDGNVLITENPNPQLVASVPVWGMQTSVRGIAMKNAHNFFPVTDAMPNPYAVLPIDTRYKKRFTAIPIPGLGLDAVLESSGE